MRYECTREGHNLSCSFIQTSVRRKADQKDLEKKLIEARESFPAFKRDSTKQCQGMEEMYQAIVLDRPPPGTDLRAYNERRAQATQIEKADMQSLLVAMRELCRNPTEANYLNMTRVSVDKDRRTCGVSSYSFAQRFRRLEQSGPWVVSEGPVGPCGIVNVSRFEPDRETQFSFWRYYAKKVITNPAGEAFPGLSCSALDQNEYLYDWRSRETQLGCDYISFDAF